MVRQYSSSDEDLQDSHTIPYIGTERPISEEVDKEWFPKFGFKPCVRHIRVKHSDIERDDSKHVAATSESYSILDQLFYREHSALEARKKFQSNLPTGRPLRKRDLDPSLPSTLGSGLSKDYKTSENLCTGIIASKFGAKSPYRLLDLLYDYELIDTFKLDDKNITTISKRDKKSKELEKAKKQASKNKEKNSQKYQKKVAKLEDELADLTGKGYPFFKITKKGKEAHYKINNIGTDDPLLIFRDLILDDSSK